MSTLKELTAKKHKEAEDQPFIKSIFAGKVDKGKYTSYLYQLRMLYTVLETFGDNLNLFDGMEDLKRVKEISLDFADLANEAQGEYLVNESTWEYINYLKTIKDDKDKIMAHIYVRHMGDLFGGQMLAKLVPGPNNMFRFGDIPSLITAVRGKINVSMADEANKAFEYNIKMIKDYNG